MRDKAQKRAYDRKRWAQIKANKAKHEAYKAAKRLTQNGKAKWSRLASNPARVANLNAWRRRYRKRHPCPWCARLTNSACFCSHKCRDASKRERLANIGLKRCCGCDSKFRPTTTRQKYCNPDCRIESKKAA